MAPASQGVFMTLIPRTDLDVFPLNLGGNTFGWTSDRETSFAVLDAYVAAGGNFIDTADGYSAWVEGHNGGESETVLGQWMAERGNRDQLVIATKASSKPDRKGLEAATVPPGAPPCPRGPAASLVVGRDRTAPPAAAPP